MPEKSVLEAEGGGGSLVMEGLSSPNLPEAVSYKGHTHSSHINTVVTLI